jgi:uracil phosphoribosyltransferase
MGFHVVDHPLIRHKMTILRDVDTSTKKFRELVSEVTLLLTYEATRTLQTTPIDVQTPLEKATGDTLETARVVIAPILRAGLGMVQGMLDLIPLASVAHIGMFRDESTLKPRVYYQSMPPEMAGATFFVVDPMLATAGSMSAAVSLIKKANPAKINVIALIASPEGKACIEREHPEVDVYVASLDRALNDSAYILPGLGDAGDRMFGSYKVEFERLF